MASSRTIFRFAPSPNGYLHLGHAYSALFAHRAAQRSGGRFLLRMEDIDPGRSKEKFVEAIVEDLTWLGVAWNGDILMQSARIAAYDAALARLEALGLTYPCFCTRADIAARSKSTDPDGAPIYPGTCRHLGRNEVAVRLDSGERPQIRLDVTEAARRAGALGYPVAAPLPEDRPQTRFARPQRWGDVVLKRKDAPASYHLAVVVDDAEQGVTHVTRGTDLEAATDIHVLLQTILGLPLPVYTFHGLILGPDGRKLSKSEGALALRAQREKGRSAAAVRRELGY